MPSQELNRKLIWSAIIAVLALVYVFVKLPEFAGRRQKELAESREIAVTIPEGYNVRQIGETFEKLGIFSEDEFVKIAQKEEGYLFPDTYRFYKTAKPEDIVAKMKDNFNKKVTAEILNQTETQKKKPDDIIIMASILEEEVKSAEDRKIVAGILWKRLSRGMGLNVDAALTYVLSKTSNELTADDLKYDSPYNTYKYRGLPPTPISNPGLDAILAALNPTPSPYFYYLTDKEGKAHYAATLEDHALNKWKYLR